MVAVAVRYAVSPHLELMCAFLAADVENLPLRHVHYRLQGQRALSDAGVASDEGDASRHESSSEDAVELSVMRVDAWLGLGGNIAEAYRFRHVGSLI